MKNIIKGVQIIVNYADWENTKSNKFTLEYGNIMGYRIQEIVTEYALSENRDNYEVYGPIFALRFKIIKALGMDIIVKPECVEPHSGKGMDDVNTIAVKLVREPYGRYMMAATTLCGKYAVYEEIANKNTSEDKAKLIYLMKRAKLFDRIKCGSGGTKDREETELDCNNRMFRLFETILRYSSEEVRRAYFNAIGFGEKYRVNGDHTYRYVRIPYIYADILDEYADLKDNEKIKMGRVMVVAERTNRVGIIINPYEVFGTYSEEELIEYCKQSKDVNEYVNRVMDNRDEEVDVITMPMAEFFTRVSKCNNEHLKIWVTETMSSNIIEEEESKNNDTNEVCKQLKQINENIGDIAVELNEMEALL